MSVDPTISDDHDLLIYVKKVWQQIYNVHRLSFRAGGHTIREILTLDPSAGVLIALRPLLLSSQGIHSDEVAAVEETRTRDELLSILDEEVQNGMLEARDATYRPTPTGRAMLVAATEAISRGLAALWPPNIDVIERGVELAHKVVARGVQKLSAEQYPGFAAMQRVSLPQATDQCLVLLTELLVLRSLYSDAQHLAREEASLSQVERDIVIGYWMQGFGVGGWRFPEPSLVEYSQEDTDEQRTFNAALRTVIDRGLISHSPLGYQLEEAGRRACESMQHGIGRFMALPYTVHDDADKVAFLEILTSLDLGQTVA